MRRHIPLIGVGLATLTLAIGPALRLPMFVGYIAVTALTMLFYDKIGKAAAAAVIVLAFAAPAEAARAQRYRYERTPYGAVAIPIRAVYGANGFIRYEDGCGDRRYVQPPPGIHDGPKLGESMRRGGKATGYNPENDPTARAQSRPSYYGPRATRNPYAR